MVGYMEAQRGTPSLSKYPPPDGSDTSPPLWPPAEHDLPQFSVLYVSSPP